MSSRDPIGTGSQPALQGKTLKRLRGLSLAGEFADRYAFSFQHQQKVGCI
jgi:hypothetical protein